MTFIAVFYFKRDVILLTALHVTNHHKPYKHDYWYAGFLFPFHHLLPPSILDSNMFSPIYGSSISKFQYSDV